MCHMYITSLHQLLPKLQFSKKKGLHLLRRKFLEEINPQKQEEFLLSVRVVRLPASVIELVALLKNEHIAKRKSSLAVTFSR